RDFHVTGVQTCALPILEHVQTDADATIATTADLTIDEVIAGTTLTVNAGGDATLGTATSTDDQQFHVDGLLTAGVLTSHTGAIRSEERRVGKEERARWS